MTTSTITTTTDQQQKKDDSSSGNLSMNHPGRHVEESCSHLLGVFS